MITEIKDSTPRGKYIVPETVIIFLRKEGDVMSSSGEDAGDEEKPGF